MELQGERLIPAGIERTWQALNDPQTLKACIAGCESLERSGDDGFDAVVAVKVGPVGARFKGHLTLADVRPPTGYTIRFDGQGGAAGFGKGSADVQLQSEGDATRLRYQAHAQVGGKIAQIGSRLVDATAGKLVNDFFTAFEGLVRAEAPAAAGAGTDVVAAPPAGPVREPAKSDSLATLWWLIAALIVLAGAYVALS